MEHRFDFIAPTSRELAFSEKGKILLPLSVALWLATNIVNWPIPLLKLGVGLVITLFLIWLVIRLGDIQRREAQSKYGFIELTPGELRISLSQRSLMRIPWHDFTGTELKNGWLRFLHRDAHIEQGGQSKRLDRVRLGDLQTPDVLLEALKARALLVK